jgi:excisionase family DNA binding protein
MANTTRNELLTINEAATRMGMSIRHVRRLVAERRIAYHRLGRSIRLDAADVAAYIAAGRVEPVGER